MVYLLRALMYVQVILGLARFAGWVRNERVWETHVTIGFLIALLALWLLRPVPGLPAPGLRAAARFVALLPLATGLLIYAGRVANPGFTWIHMVLGLATVGTIDAALKRERRWRRAPAGGTGAS